MIVCVCRRVSDRAVDAAVQAGARDLDAIALATGGAGTDCGCCREELAARVEAAPAPSSVHAVHASAPAAGPRPDAPCCANPCAGCPRVAAVPSRAA